MEVKIKLKDKTAFLRQLENVGVKYQADLVHKDIYYNLPDGLRKFSETDEALRLRSNTEYFFDDKTLEKKLVTKTSDITYKGPKLDKTTKSRIEHVCHITESDVMDQILLVLGFQKVITIEKNRKVYHLEYQNQHVEILIDQIQHLDGFYSEFEIMVESREDMENARVIIFDLLNKVGYSEKDSIKISYLELVLEKLGIRQ